MFVSFAAAGAESGSGGAAYDSLPPGEGGKKIAAPLRFNLPAGPRGGGYWPWRGECRQPLFLVACLLLRLLFRLVAPLVRALERSTEDVAQGRARIGRAVLGDGLLLLGHFERLDGDRDLVAAAVELGDPGIDLLADREPLRPLLAAIARELRALDEGGEIGADDLHIDAGLLDLGDLAGNHRALLDVAGAFGGERIAFELLD